MKRYRPAVGPMAEQYVLPTGRSADLLPGGAGPIERSVAAVLASMGVLPTGRSADLLLGGAGSIERSVAAVLASMGVPVFR